MAINLFANQLNAKTAVTTKTWAQLGFDSSNITIIYLLDPGNSVPIATWKPGDPFSTLTGIVADKGYLVQPKVNLDKSADFAAPIPLTTTTTTTTTSSTTSTTTTYNQSSTFRYASSTDATNIPNANVGDYLLTGPNLTNGETSIDIRPNFNNTFTLDQTSGCKKVLIKSGNYDRISINVPGLTGTQSCPIVITNYGGQVKCKSLIISGVSYFKLTGRYNSGNKTGDSGFTGHASGYAYSSGKYGIWISNGWTDVEQFLLGIAGSVTSQATNWEVEYLEMSDGGFSNIFKWDNQGTPMVNCSVHDIYAHDQHGEGVYVGSTGSGTQNPFINLHFYNNRVLRVGNEGLQLGQLREGCVIENNVVHGAINWKSPFGEYQDNSLQIGIRNGNVILRKNLFINAGEKFVNLFTNGSFGDITPSGIIDINTNVFLYNHGPLGAYLGQSALLAGVNFELKNNYFGKSKFDYGEVYTDSRAINSPHLLRIANDANFLLQNNTWDGTDGRTEFYRIVTDNHPSVTEINTTNRVIPDVEFINYMGFPAGFQYTNHEQWASLIGQTWGIEDQFGYGGTKKGQPVTYIAGDYVTHKSKLYKALLNNEQIEPGVAANWATYWQLITFTKPDTTTTTTPPDDVRLVATSFYNYVGAGLTDNPAYTGTTTTTTSTTTIAPTTTTTTTSTSSTTTTTTTASPLANKLALSAETDTNGFTLKWENTAPELTASPRVIGIGSSSLAGNGASTYAKSYPGLFQTQLGTVSSNTGIFANNALSGLDTRAALPDGADALVRENRNISMALGANPTAIIIAFPTNDIINGLTPQQFTDNIKRIYDLARASNAATFVLSVQPRTSATLSQQLDLVKAFQMIKSVIPVESFVDTFELLRDTGTSNPADINPLYNADGIHVNDAGHQLIYTALWNKVSAFFQDPNFTQYIIESAQVSSYGDVPNSWSTFDTVVSSTTVSKTYTRADGTWKAYRVRARKPDTTFTLNSNPIWIYQPVFAGSTVEQTVQVDFSLDSVAAPPADWNNLSVTSTGPTLNQAFSLLTSTGTASGITLSVTGLFGGAGSGGANSGVYPQRVMQDSWNTNNNANVKAQIKLSGLSSNNVYDLEFTSSRSTSTFDRLLIVDVQDDSRVDKTGSLSCIQSVDVANQFGIITLKGIYSANGEIYINVRCGGSLGYLNAVVIKRVSNSAVSTTTTTTTTVPASSTTTTTTTSGTTNPQFLTTVNSWNAYVKLPDDYYTATSKYYKTVIFFPGQGETGTDASKLLVNGPSKFINQGWNSTVVIDGVPEQSIYISLQPPTNYPPETSINTRIQTLKSMYRIDSTKLSLTGLSHGGWCAETFVTGDPYGGPYTYANQVVSVVAVQAVRPDDNAPYPNLFDNFALAGGRWLGFEQSQDGRDMLTIANRMNAASANSAIYKQTAFCNPDGTGCGSHCCWDEYYNPLATFSGLDGRTESIYQWMARQANGLVTTSSTTTTTTTSGGTTTTTTSTTSGPTTTTTSSTTTTTTTLLSAQFNFNATAQSVAGFADVAGNPNAGTVSATQNGITVSAVGGATKWGAQASTSATNTGGQSTGVNSGMAPDNVLVSYFYNNGNTLTPVDDNIEISGLNTSGTYRFDIYASRGGVPSRIAAFKLRDNAGSELDDNFNVGNNTSVIKTFTGKVPDGAGKCYLTVKMPSTGTTGNGNMFGYINGLKVTRLT